MAFEIEYKYLVKRDLWDRVSPTKSARIKQGYLSSEPGKSIRVRVLDEKGFITIKGATVGARRLEYEYEIPVQDAEELLSEFCTKLVSKTRHYVEHRSHIWEVDVFDGLNSGLVIAEIELQSEDETYSKPEWIGEDVTHDFRYSNSNLSLNPYSTW